MTKLPEIPMTLRLTKEWDSLYLDFITGLYISSYKDIVLSIDKSIWFLEQIAYYLCLKYPDKDATELEELLEHINNLAKHQTKLKEAL